MGKNLRRLFEQGRYEEILESKSMTLKPGESPWLMGAAVFKGDWEKASSIFPRTQTEGPEATTIGLYFKGLGALRRSDYPSALKYFKRNFSTSSQDGADRLSFFRNQGPAIFHYFRGDFARARHWGEKAFAVADGADFAWGEVVSRDLLAHCYFHLGAVRRSQDSFEKGIARALPIPNPSLIAAMKISSLKYAAQAGLYGGDAVTMIEGALLELDAHDTYSRIELLMELSRQQTLCGRLGAAEEALNHALPLVHRFQNKRQIARLNFRLAYLQYLRGQDLPALSLLHAGSALLERRVDHSILQEFAGLEGHILAQDSRFDTSLDQKVPLHKFSSFWSRRIYARGPMAKSEISTEMEGPIARGEDPLGDLLDTIAERGPGATEALIKAGYHGLLPKALGLNRGGRYLLAGVTAKGLVIVSDGSVLLKKDGMTNLMGKLLLSLSEGRKTKSALIASVWGYDYESLRHDPLLYRALTSLRKLLAPVEDWIQYDGEAYLLAKSVVVRTFAEMTEVHIAPGFDTAENPVVTPESGTGPRKFDPRLNHRQNLFVRTWPEAKPIDVREYASKFKVSIPSATRDLSGLCTHAYVQRLGKARATRYIR